MIKSTPNRNLLTVADSPFQHHLVSLIIYLYIYIQIQMLLDSPPAPSSRLRSFVAMVLLAISLRKESLVYNTQGGRIVLLTACDKEVATFAFGQEAQWRNGKDNRPHLYVEGNPVGFRDPSGNNAGMGLIQMFSSLISQPISNELLVYATFATGKGGRAARDLALVNVTTSFLSGSSDYGFSNLNTTQQQNLFYLLAATKTGARIGDAFKRIFRSVDHSLKKIARAGDHVSKFIAKSADNYLRDEARKYDKFYKSAAKGIAGTARRIAKGMDGGARWLISGGNFSRNNGNDIDHALGNIGINTNEFFDTVFRKKWSDTNFLRHVYSIVNPGSLAMFAAEAAAFFIGPTAGSIAFFLFPISSIISICSNPSESVQCFGR
jgi:hypothetical protein